MPGAAIVAAALTNHSAHFASIFIDGLDVIKEPASPSRYAVPLSSINVDESGPDGVSSMQFTIECSTALPITVVEGQEVRFEQVAGTGYLWFRGWVDHVDYENMDGDVGTRFIVRAVGIEALLDWAVLPGDVTIAGGTDPGTAVQALAAASVAGGLGVLRTFGDGTSASTQAAPVATGWIPANLTANAVTVTAGTTLREAIRQVSAQAFPFGQTYWTVDFYGGLRYYNTNVGDVLAFSVDDDPPLAGTATAEALSYGIDAAQTRGVVVKGTGVTVTVGDGSGKAGAFAVLSDSTLTTVAAATLAGTGYLAQYAVTARGQFTLTDFPLIGLGTTAHAFQIGLTITDGRVGLTNAQGWRVTALSQSNFTGLGREDIVFSFGGRPPSLTALTRQLTRTVLS